LLDKPIYLYVYDFDEYKKSRGLNLDWFNEIPEYTSKNAKELLKIIDKDNYDLSKLDDIKDRYLSARDNNCTKEIVDLIYPKSVK
jgi:CDP-ribitol ribitolphosphotransferase